MLSAIIATRESERTLVPTLAALVPGALSGLVIEVIVADGGSRDATREVADVAGCRFLSSQAALGARLKQAAVLARAPWLLFLRAGTVPEPSWITAVGRFIEEARNNNNGGQRTAAFRAQTSDGVRNLLGAIRPPGPDQGLLISRAHYDALGGHADGDDCERRLLRRLGWRLGKLAAKAMPPQR
ncbi:MAG: glycosyltransferase [Pseudolabrys sp.]